MSDRQQLRQKVELRAEGRCEYCRMHQSLQGATFHLEHIRPLSQGGTNDLENVALACPSCNLHKSDRIRVVDPETKQQVPLFHPRQHNWQTHFKWDDYAVVGLTAIGRATLSALKLNQLRRLQIRQVEQRLRLFPPRKGITFP